MSADMKLSLVQMNSVPDRDTNVDKACAYIDEVVERDQPDLIVIPEFFNMIYVFQYRDYKYIEQAEPDDGYSIGRIRDKARQHKTHIIATIYEEESAGVYYDTAMVIDPEGQIIGKYRKVHPAAFRSLEKLYFRFGSYFPVFRIGEWRVGINICYDTLFPESARCSAVNGAELIVVPFAAYELPTWREMMISRAYDNAVYFAPCNKVGHEGDWDFGGCSMIVDPEGAVLAEAGNNGDRIISADLSREAVFKARQYRPVFRDRRPDLYKPLSTPTEDIARIE